MRPGSPGRPESPLGPRTPAGPVAPRLPAGPYLKEEGGELVKASVIPTTRSIKFLSRIWIMDNLPWHQLCRQLQVDHGSQDFPVRKYTKHRRKSEKILPLGRTEFIETWHACKKSWCPSAGDTITPSQKTSSKPQRNVWEKHSAKVGQPCFQTNFITYQIESQWFKTADGKQMPPSSRKCTW